MPKEKSFESSIPSNAYESAFKQWVDTEWMRQKIISVLGEELEKVSFANKVKIYAAEEMDKRVFRSFQYWGVVVLTAIITTALGIFISKWLS